MSKRVCPRAGCEIATSGVCMEGFKPLEQCPYSQVIEDGDEAPISDQEQEGEYQRVSNGEALTLSAANAISSARASRLIVLAGAAGSGKTTLLTSIYEKFLEAPFAGFEFAGSETLVGFERRCYLGRAISQGETPQTSRTPAKRDARVLHLRLAAGQAVIPDLLLVDVSGEQFRLARDTDKGARALSFLSRADSFALLIDGAKLADARRRANAYQDARSILRSLVESDVVRDDLDVEVLFTKWDVLRATVETRGDGFLERLQSEMSAEFAGHRLSFAPVAARPERDPSLPFAHGLGELLCRWSSVQVKGAGEPVLWGSDVSPGARQSVLFGARQLKRQEGHVFRTA